MNNQNIILQPEISIVEITPEYYEVTVSAVGESGPAGPAGPTGPAGPEGPAGGSSTFIQNAPLNQWTITHALGFYPSVTVVDSGGSRVFGDLQYTDATTILATFTDSFSGVAYLS